MKFIRTIEIEIDYDALLYGMCEWLDSWYYETEYEEKITKEDVHEVMFNTLHEQYGLEDYDNFDDNLVIIKHDLKRYIVENNLNGVLAQIIERLL